MKTFLSRLPHVEVNAHYRSRFTYLCVLGARREGLYTELEINHLSTQSDAELRDVSAQI